MVIVSDAPPDPGDPIAVWMGVDDLDMPRAWTPGHVVRIQTDAGSAGEAGVVIELDAPKAEAIWCLIPRGDEDEVPLPRRLPEFPEPKKKKKRRKKLSEDSVRSPRLETIGDGQEEKTPHAKPRPKPVIEPAEFGAEGLEDVPTTRLDPTRPRRGTKTVKIKRSEIKAAVKTKEAAKKKPVSTAYRQVQTARTRPKARAEGKADPQAKQHQLTPDRVRQIGAKPSREKAPGRAPTGKHRTKAPTVGIDFGTTYSKIALFEDGEITLIEDTTSTSSTRASIPSVVAYRTDGSVVVGESAQELLAVEPGLVISSVKRVMGLNFSDPLANGLLASLSCPSIKGPNDTILFDMHGQLVTVPEVASKILEHLKNMASAWAGIEVKEAVFTIPVDFDRRAKRELELAARMAGLEAMAFVPEPVSAAMGCGYDGSSKAVVAVYDFGGGTFDVSIVEVGHDRFVVRGAAGDRWLGGDDFDELMARFVSDEFHKKTGVVLRNRVEEWQRLLFACEEAKRWLSTLNSVDVVLPRAARNAEGEQTLLVPVTRAAFEDMSQDVIASAVEVCFQASRQAGIKPQEIDSLLITGGSTRIPTVRNAAQKLFGKPAAVGIHPQHAVVIGAAVRAAVLSGAPVPEDYAQRLRGQGTVGRTIGLALAGGTTEHIITEGDRAPVAAHRLYSTSRDAQTSIRIELVQGKSQQTAQNHRVGGFVIDGLPPKKAGTISLDVYFELSTTGTFTVTAQDRDSGQRAHGIFELDV